MGVVTVGAGIVVAGGTVAGVVVVVAGGTVVGVVVVVEGESPVALDGRTSTSHFDLSSITYRVPSLVLTSVSFPPSFSVAAA